MPVTKGGKVKKLSGKNLMGISARRPLLFSSKTPAGGYSYHWCLALMCLIAAVISVEALSADEPSESPKRAVIQGKMPSMPGVSPGKLEFLEAGKADLLEQRTAKEMMVSGNTDLPQRSALAIPSFSADARFTSIYGSPQAILPPEMAPPEAEGMPKTIPENLPVEVTPPGNIIFQPVGTILTIKKASGAIQKTSSRIKAEISAFFEVSSEKIIHIDPKTLPLQVKSSIENLSEVKDVAVFIPGAEYLVTSQPRQKDVKEYSVDDNIFTIDSISLEKTAKGEFVPRVPPEAAKDVEHKVLCFNSSKDDSGKTIKMKLEEGSVQDLAKVLVKWAEYSELGFNFDRETEETVVKALIKTKGVGTDDSFVKLEDKYISSGLLETEIKKIVGDDDKVIQRIYAFIGSGTKVR